MYICNMLFCLAWLIPPPFYIISFEMCWSRERDVFFFFVTGYAGLGGSVVCACSISDHPPIRRFTCVLLKKKVVDNHEECTELKWRG